MRIQESPWTEDRTAELLKYFKLDLSCSQIGKRIGVTRNAVIGKLHRMGLSRPLNPVEKKAKQPRAYISRIRAYKPKPILQRVHDAVERSPKNKTLLDLCEGDCKWPLGEEAPYLFCAHEVTEGLPYCAYHARTAYTFRPHREHTPRSFARNPGWRAA